LLRGPLDGVRVPGNGDVRVVACMWPAALAEPDRAMWLLPYGPAVENSAGLRPDPDFSLLALVQSLVLVRPGQPRSCKTVDLGTRHAHRFIRAHSASEMHLHKRLVFRPEVCKRCSDNFERDRKHRRSIRRFSSTSGERLHGLEGVINTCLDEFVLHGPAE